MPPLPLISTASLAAREGFYRELIDTVARASFTLVGALRLPAGGMLEAGVIVYSEGGALRAIVPDPAALVGTTIAPWLTAEFRAACSLVIEGGRGEALYTTAFADATGQTRTYRGVVRPVPAPAPDGLPGTVIAWHAVDVTDLVHDVARSRATLDAIGQHALAVLALPPDDAS